MAELPVARVVRGVLAPAPRKVPLALSLRMLFGGVWNGMVYFTIAVSAWLLAYVDRKTATPKAEDAPPIQWIVLGLVGLAAPVILGFMIYALLKLRLLRRGLTVHGKLVNKREVETGESSVWYYTFKYEVGGTDYTIEHKFQTRELLLEDDPLELMVYMPMKPHRAYPVDHIPGNPTIDADGQLRARDKHVWLAFIMPAAAISGVLAAYYW
jgi:hypothetical protein